MTFDVDGHGWYFTTLGWLRPCVIVRVGDQRIVLDEGENDVVDVDPADVMTERPPRA